MTTDRIGATSIIPGIGDLLHVVEKTGVNNDNAIDLLVGRLVRNFDMVYVSLSICNGKFPTIQN